MPIIEPGKALVTCGWDDVPHLDAQTKRELLAATPPHLRDARSKGTPSLGAGAIYPVELSEVLVDPFEIPPYFPRAYALDVGWNRTAALWGAKDRTTGIIYLYTEHYRGQAEPSVHATAINARGRWIPGTIDPAARGRGQKDGVQLLQDYRDLGLRLVEADNALEAGLFDVFERLSTGRLKAFSTLMNWQAEYRLYRRDEKGKVVKEFDHLMDAMRYLIRMFDRIATVQGMERTMVSAGAGRGDSRAGY